MADEAQAKKQTDENENAKVTAEPFYVPEYDRSVEARTVKEAAAKAKQSAEAEEARSQKERENA